MNVDETRVLFQSLIEFVDCVKERELKGLLSGDSSSKFNLYSLKFRNKIENSPF